MGWLAQRVSKGVAQPRSATSPFPAPAPHRLLAKVVLRLHQGAPNRGLAAAGRAQQEDGPANLKDLAQLRHLEAECGVGLVPQLKCCLLDLHRGTQERWHLNPWCAVWQPSTQCARIPVFRACPPRSKGRCLPSSRTLASKSRSTARGTCSTVRGNRSPSSPMKMEVSSAVSFPRLKSRSARSRTLSSAAWQVRRGTQACLPGWQRLAAAAAQARGRRGCINQHAGRPAPPDSSGAARFMLPATYSVVLMARSFQS